MTKRKSNQAGGSSSAMTATQRDTQSSIVELTQPQESLGILGTLASILPQSPTFQPTPNSLADPHLTHAKIISAFAAKLGALVEWRKIELADGRKGYALFFCDANWLIDPVSKELTPLKDKP